VKFKNTLSTIVSIALISPPINLAFASFSPEELGIDTSSESKEISIKVGKRIKISGLDNIIFPEWNIGMGSQINEDEICVYSNGDGGYNVLATSENNADSSFAMATKDGSKKIKYQAEWADIKSGDYSYVSLINGKITNEAFRAERKSADCSDGNNNAKIKISISGVELQQANSSDSEYIDTLTITISSS